MIAQNGVLGSEFWVNSYNSSFSEIQRASNVRVGWRDYLYVKDSYLDKILHPVNMYVSHMYPKPELVSIEKNIVTLRQKTHAEIWVEPKNKNLYALDKCHQRQFYPSKELFSGSECFTACYRFYIPWFINKNLIVKIKNIDNEFSPFVIQEKTFISDAPKEDAIIFNTEFVNFSIRKTGKHMLSDEYGIIDIASPMFDMVATLEDQDIDKLKEEYGI
jgi:hypothetical protein